jgi:hypothetical protein
MKYEDYVKEFERLATYTDYEATHEQADRLLCDIVISVATGDIPTKTQAYKLVEMFKSLTKWYA